MYEMCVLFGVGLAIAAVIVGVSVLLNKTERKWKL